MSKRRTNKSVDACGECCHVQALVRIDDRGQMVLPKELRDRANIRAGDKLALITRLQAEMERAAETLEFEQAAKLRDRIRQVRQQMDDDEWKRGRKGRMKKR